MPSITLRMSAAEHSGWQTCANKLRVPLTTWIRLTLNAESDNDAATAAEHAESSAPKRYVKPGPKPEPLDVFVSNRVKPGSVPFPSGQRKFSAVEAGWDHYEELHAAAERDIAAAHASGAKRMEFTKECYPEYTALRLKLPHRPDFLSHLPPAPKTREADVLSVLEED